MTIWLKIPTLQKSLNGEGWDIAINERIISLTWGQLEAINYLIKSLEYRS